MPVAIVCCVSVLILGAVVPCRAGNPPARVLVIDSESADLPLWVEFSAAFKKALREGSESPVDAYFEHLDFARFRERSNLDRAAAWLAEKYRNDPPDVIVTVGPESYRLMGRQPGLFAGETSMVSVAVDPKTFNDVGRLPRSTALLRDFGQAATVRLALGLLPATRRLAIVGGPADPQSYSRFVRAPIFADFAESLEIIDLSGLPMSEMRARVADLPDNTVLVLTAMAVDGDRRPFTHPEVIEEISPVATAPLFGSIKVELGHGSVGGHLFDPGLSGRQTAALVARVLNGEPAESIEPKLVDSSVVAFDWRELERWRIPEDRLPPDSVVEFRPPTLWEEHRRAVLLALGLISFQAISIMALLRARDRRKRINLELRSLTARLITAQEDERRRLARDLHDDFSQRLALLAIEVESSVPEQRIEAVSSKVQGLARDVHTLAHHLFPPRLEGSGLVSELALYCDEIGARHELQVDCRLPEFDIELPGDVGLALFRVAQEAVQNAVKHSVARVVSVELAVSPRWASITIADNGRGFDPDQLTTGRGLGLASMRERMRLVDGWLNIDGHPERGTTVSAWVPVPSRKGDANGETSHPHR